MTPHRDTPAPAAGHCSPCRPASPHLASALHSAASSSLWHPLQCRRDGPAGLLHRVNRPASPQVWPSPPAVPPAAVTQRLGPSCPLPSSGCLLLVPLPHLSLSRILTIRIKLSLSHLETLRQNLTRRVYAAKAALAFPAPWTLSKACLRGRQHAAACSSLGCVLFVSTAKQCSGGQPAIPRSGSALSTMGEACGFPLGEWHTHSHGREAPGAVPRRGSGVTGVSDPVCSRGVN